MPKKDSMKAYHNEIKAKARELRLSGISLTNIAKQLSVPVSGVHRWTKDIRIRAQHPCYRTEQIVHDYFAPDKLKQFPERFVLIGFLAADGCVHNKKSKGKVYPYLCMNLAKKDQNVLNIFNDELASGTRHLSPGKKTHSLQFYIPSQQICSDLSRFGIVPQKTKTYRLPLLERDQMRYFLRGYFYGDGCVGKGKYPYYHLVGNAAFAEDVKNYMIAHEIVKHCCVSPLKNNHGYSQFLFQNQNAPKFADFIFNDEKMMLLPRKHS